MNPGRMLGLFVGAIIGLFAVVGIAKNRAHEARAGWNLRPIVVAATDIPADTEITFDMISQRSMPEQFVSPSYVTPDVASVIVGKKITSPVVAGDPIAWQLFVHSFRQERITDCALYIGSEVKKLPPGNDEAATALAEKWFKDNGGR